MLRVDLGIGVSNLRRVTRSKTTASSLFQRQPLVIRRPIKPQGISKSGRSISHIRIRIQVATLETERILGDETGKSWVVVARPIEVKARVVGFASREFRTIRCSDSVGG